MNDDPTLSTREVRAKLGNRVTVAQLCNWARNDGCDAAERRGREWRWDMEKLEAWLQAEADQGRHRVGASAIIPADRIPDELKRQIRDADSLAKLEAVGREVSILVLERAISSAIGSTVQRLLSETRQTLKTRALVEKEEAGRQPEVLATPQGVKLLQQFETILNGKRREQILLSVADHAAADKRDFPDDVRQHPEKVRDKLKQLGIDAWGEES